MCQGWRSEGKKKIQNFYNIFPFVYEKTYILFHYSFFEKETFSGSVLFVEYILTKQEKEMS